MTFTLESLVEIQNNVKEMFLMMPSTKIAEIVLLIGKRVGRAIDKKYLQMKSPKPLVQNQIISQKLSQVALYQNRLECSAWLNNMASRAKNRNIFKSYNISLATGQYISYSCAWYQVSDPGPLGPRVLNNCA